MTELQWLESVDPISMYNFLNRKIEITERKAWLAVIEIEREFWGKNISRQNIISLKKLEAIADGTKPSRFSRPYFLSYSIRAGARETLEEGLRIHNLGDQKVYQADLLREIWGNPFREEFKVMWDKLHQISPGCAPKPPSWLNWREGTISKIANKIYREKTFEDLPILADALEEAGCTNEDIINHCRNKKVCTESKCVLVLGKGKYEYPNYYCSTCSGTGLVDLGLCSLCKGEKGFEEDTGGVEPWGEPISIWIKCEGCKGIGKSNFCHVRGCWVIDLLIGKR